MAELPAEDLSMDAVPEEAPNAPAGKGAKSKKGASAAPPRNVDKKVFKGEQSLEVLKILGKGFYGTVYKVKDKLDGKNYAVKEIPCGKDLKSSLAEVMALAEIIHSGVVRYYHPWTEKDGDAEKSLCYKMELCEMTLADWLDKYKKPEDRDRMKMLGIFYQLLATVAYLHSKEGKKRAFIHRDLKPDNVFTMGKAVKVGDFGLAKNIGSPIQGKRKGNPSPYAAPELYTNPKDCSEKVDVFSLGIILLDLLVPFETQEARQEALRKAKEGDFTLVQDQCPPKELELVKWLCQPEVQGRPHAFEVIASEHCKDFVQQVDGRSDPLVTHAVVLVEEYSRLEQDLEVDKLSSLPADLKREFYDAVIIHHEDEEDLAKEYKDKIESLTVKGLGKPRIALPRDIEHGGGSEVDNIRETPKLSSIIYLLVTPAFAKCESQIGKFAIDMHITQSNLYPNGDRKHFVYPIFTQKKTTFTPLLRGDVLALAGISCSEGFDEQKFIRSLTECQREYTRPDRERMQDFEQRKYLLQKQMERMQVPK